MNELKEALLLVKLLNSKFLKKKFGTISGCKSDFEIELGISENDKDFRKWLDLLISENILNVFDIKKVNCFKKSVNFYAVNKSLVLKKLNSNDVYLLFERAFEDGKIVI